VLVKKDRSSDGSEIVIQQKGAGVRVQGKISVVSDGKPVKREHLPKGYAYLLIDCSSSMEGDPLKQAKKGVIGFAKKARSRGYATGLIMFNSDAELLLKPGVDDKRLESQVGKLRSDGSTNMAAAIALAVKEFAETSGKRVIILATDGFPDSIEHTLEEANKASSQHIDIITIATEDADREFLRRIATRTDLAVETQARELAKGISSTAKMLPDISNNRLKE